MRAVVRLAHRVTPAPQRSKVARGLAGQADPAGFENVQLEQLPLDMRRGRLVAHALQHFADNQVSDAKPLALKCPVEPVGFGMAGHRYRCSCA
jgi:hypothetical protein